MLAASLISLKVVLAECLKIEKRLFLRMLYHEDFGEDNVKILIFLLSLIDKDNLPKWKYRRAEDVPDYEVEAIIVFRQK